ncbi:unnamed protein product [Lactuca virosa]|uniref:DUF4283 domain-containing protein n=1 Tax=Lactuca virosa TaxID=75947 RepID=A0AAU9N5H7_9ASTR|nr:unnamed protein product [Lactuca virosa]
MSLDHLGHLPKLLLIINDILMEIKYMGGLKVLLQFNDSITAKEFRDNKQRWQEHLKWVDWGDKIEREFDRVAWIRIMGLPLHLWGESNFAKITEGYGATIAPFDELPNRVDLSCVKIGILTERRTRINEEIFVSFEGELIKLGIIEFDEDWFPFKFDPNEDYYEKEEPSEVGGTDEEDDDEDGVSDTWMQEDNGEKEEGEISPVFKGKEYSAVREEPIQGERSPTVSKILVMPEESTVSVRVVQETSRNPQRPLTVPMESDGSPPGNHTAIISNGTPSSPQNREDTIRPTEAITTPPSNGPRE